MRDRRLRLGQVDARQRRAVQGRGQPPAPRAQAPGRASRDPRPRPARQDHPGRPVADRAHAALEPGDLHGPVRRDPRPVLEDAGGARARLQAGPLQLQRQGRALRGLPRRRADQDRDALPARRLRAVRTVPRQALQPRDAGDPLQGQERSPTCSTCRSRRRSKFFEHIPKIRRRLETLGRGRARLRPPRPAGDDALRRRGSAREARDRAVEGRHRDGRSTSSTSRRRGCTSPTSSGCWRCCSGWSTPGNSVVVIEHNLDVIKSGRPDHRHGPRGRRGGRAGRRHRHARGGRRRARLAHRPVPRRAPAAAPSATRAPRKRRAKLAAAA